MLYLEILLYLKLLTNMKQIFKSCNVSDLFNVVDAKIRNYLISEHSPLLHTRYIRVI